jgi:GAF domain-containing protein
VTRTSNERREQADVPGDEARASHNVQALAEMSRLINAQLDPQQLCDTVVHLLQQRFAYEYVSVFTLEPLALRKQPYEVDEAENATGHSWLTNQSPFRVPAPAEPLAPTDPDLARWRLIQRATTPMPGSKRVLPLTRGVTARTVRQGRASLVVEVADDPDYFTYIEGVLSEIAIPLIHRHDLLGVLNVESAQRRLDTSDLALLEVVGDLLAVALHNARLYWQVQQERDAARNYTMQLVALHDVGRHLLSTQRLHDTLEQITSAALELSEGVYAALHLPDAEQRELLLVAPRSTRLFVEEEREPYLRQPIQHGVSGLCFAQARPVYIEAVQQDERLAHPNHIEGFGINSLLALPLIAEGQVLGVLSVGHHLPDAFPPQLQQVLVILADKAATAMHRAGYTKHWRAPWPMRGSLTTSRTMCC